MLSHITPPDLSTIVRRLQYVCRILLARDLTPYPSNISRHLDLPKTSYAFFRSN